MKKRNFIFVICVSICLMSLIGCGEKSNQGNNTTNLSNESNISSDIPENGKYKVKMDENKVSVVSNLGGNISTTEYIYENDMLVSSRLIQKNISSSVAKSNYDIMVNEPTIMAQYKDIKLDGDTIILTTKDELIEALKVMTMQEMYDTQKSTYGMYE